MRKNLSMLEGNWGQFVDGQKGLDVSHHQNLSLSFNFQNRNETINEMLLMDYGFSQNSTQFVTRILPCKIFFLPFEVKMKSLSSFLLVFKSQLVFPNGGKKKSQKASISREEQYYLSEEFLFYLQAEQRKDQARVFLLVFYK